MSVTKIASRYAKSLIDLAIEQDKLDKILEDIQLLQSVADNRDFYLLLKSPIVKTGKKLSIFKELFAGKVDDLTLAFINILAKKGREEYLPEIYDEFIKQYKALKHISTVKLTTATPIAGQIIKAIKGKLAESEVTDENIEIETYTDESLIGGFIIEIGDNLYDASVAHKIQELKKELKEDKLVKSL